MSDKTDELAEMARLEVGRATGSAQQTPQSFQKVANEVKQPADSVATSIRPARFEAFTEAAEEASDYATEIHDFADHVQAGNDIAERILRLRGKPRGTSTPSADSLQAKLRDAEHAVRRRDEELDAIHRALRDVTRASAPDECSALDLVMLVRERLNTGTAYEAQFPHAPRFHGRSETIAACVRIVDEERVRVGKNESATACLRAVDRMRALAATPCAGDTGPARCSYCDEPDDGTHDCAGRPAAPKASPDGGDHGDGSRSVALGSSGDGDALRGRSQLDRDGTSRAASARRGAVDCTSAADVRAGRTRPGPAAIPTADLGSDEDVVVMNARPCYACGTTEDVERLATGACFDSYACVARQRRNRATSEAQSRCKECGK